MKKIFNALLFFGSFLIVKAQNQISIVNNEMMIKGNYSLLTDFGDLETTNKSIQMIFLKSYTSNEFLFALSYENDNRMFKDMQELNLFSSLENSHSIEIFTSYTKKLQDEWSTAISFYPQINSTFERVLSSNDFMIGGNFQLCKNWPNDNLDKGAQMKFGIHYDGLFGRPILYPSISYTNFISTSWNYTIGFPFSRVNYSVNQFQDISLNVGPEGNYTNNSRDITINNTNFSNSKLEYSALFINLDYYLKFDSNWTTKFGFSYLPVTELRILDSHDNEIYAFDSKPSLRINFGITYKLNKL